MIEQIIDIINKDGLNGISKNQKTFGVAQQIFRVNESEVVDFIPGIVNNNGEIKYIGVDDVNDLILYHKITSANISFENGYGDGRFSRNIYSCFLICLYDISKINIDAADMIIVLQSQMPQTIIGMKDIRNVSITSTGAVLNSAQVFNSEYKYGEKNMLLPSNIFFVQLNYNIQITFDQTCINKCIC